MSADVSYDTNDPTTPTTTSYGPIRFTSTTGPSHVCRWTENRRTLLIFFIPSTTFSLIIFLLFRFSSSQSRPLNDGSFKFAAKTSFSCTGRAAGYYADVETGCQIYHMCDGLGRQFSYACPNTTLFQQRMLICDHWYMVNCSKAESNYAANLLIGQRDKPFVPEEENEIRTPRPDLLDRPDGFAFGGPSLKNFFKSNAPAVQNAIVDAQARTRPTTIEAGKGQQSARKSSVNAEIFQESASNHGLPIHWSTRYAKEDDNATSSKEQDIAGKNKRDDDRNESRQAVTIATGAQTDVRPVVAGVKVPSRRYEPPFTPAEYEQRSTEQKPTVATTTTRVIVSTTAAPPTTTTARPQFSSTRFNPTNPPVTTTRTPSSISVVQQPPNKVTQQLLPLSKPTQNAGETLTDPRQSILPPTAILFNAPAATAGLFSGGQRPLPAGVSVPSRDLLPPYENLANFDQIKTRYTSESIYTRQPITNEPSAGPVKSAIDKLGVADPLPIASLQPAQDKVPRPFSVPKPANDLEPPHREYVFYDDATTQGPPIYYQWKWSVPSFGLEPPGLEAPAPPGEPTRNETPLSFSSTNLDRTAAPSERKVVKEGEELFAQLNPAAHEQEGHDGGQRGRQHNQTARSISSETGNLGENRVEVESKQVVALPQHNYLQLRQQFAIPDFTFPLDGAVKEGQYGDAEARDSFQVRIPSDVAARDRTERAWYGENARCPECHPGFLRPGSCEPCVKIRR
ncbi:uncharacterized protein LOC131284796 [Anopheles ziemanni]|uniref:uncharacterized protein LOC131261570 n=1 Tax=Anopheles coustani TaxID=139045 RepID=UPI0026596C75|nr:uncharacterized protein LOC131261570 [Anopheles coustani]XP_058169638.1 uncharacterized protein LOC131284796 [Anopheles ziemanni]